MNGVTASTDALKTFDSYSQAILNFDSQIEVVSTSFDSAGDASRRLAEVLTITAENIDGLNSRAVNAPEQQTFYPSFTDMLNSFSFGDNDQAAKINAAMLSLSGMAQTAAQMAQKFNISQAQAQQKIQQNITVSPTINVDLGGAYVFDDEMKQQLTDDITAEVANAVTSAVQDATSKANYGYGN